MADPELTVLQARYVQLRAQVLAADSPLDKADLVTALLNVIGQLAAHAPNADLQARWMERYRVLMPQAENLRGAVAAQVDAPPGELLRALDRFSDQALDFGGTVVRAAGQVVGGLGALGASLPVLLLVALVVAGIVGVGYVRHGGVSVRRS